MLRRHFNLTLGSLALGSLALRSYATGADAQKGATFWLITRGKGRIFLLGFGEAKDKAWYSPLIQRALQESADRAAMPPRHGAMAGSAFPDCRGPY